MVERRFETDRQTNGHDLISDAASRVREDVEKFVEGFNLQEISKKVEEFGRENPIGLASIALGLGVAAGFLMRSRGQTMPRDEDFSSRF